ncbi:glycerophosphodiester phosphodiesterase family protein [Abyssalbus ytuae]|uniref:GP-PDE domain-containing protein n=1 Tax=Abyssalbus ytuae TaxID=2926907 RepID=A0A9E6ZKC2_9FLAO|nr:glycerophosphodiester phosphodiesterase family protein [Abyssalbus ytuae]UOB17264.1 hypothetical protein MQE35_16200 [Abyssalbus ytuae]
MKTTAFTCILLIFLFQAKAQEFIAHRGASWLAPENTLASVNLAWKLNADAVEIDIHLSKDNKLMVIHDSNTLKTSGAKHKIKTTHSELLRKLDVGISKDPEFKGERIPFLEEVIKTIPPDKKLVIELKSRKETIPFLKKTVTNSNKQKQLVFICFDWDTITELKKTFPENDCYWLSNNRSEVLRKLNKVAENNLNGIDLKYSIIDSTIMQKATQLNLDVIAYTVNKPLEAKRLITLGVKGITTDKPNWLKQNLQ